MTTLWNDNDWFLITILFFILDTVWNFVVVSDLVWFLSFGMKNMNCSFRITRKAQHQYQQSQQQQQQQQSQQHQTQKYDNGQNKEFYNLLLLSQQQQLQQQQQWFRTNDKDSNNVRWIDNSSFSSSSQQQQSQQRPREEEEEEKYPIIPIKQQQQQQQEEKKSHVQFRCQLLPKFIRMILLCTRMIAIVRNEPISEGCSSGSSSSTSSWCCFGTTVMAFQVTSSTRTTAFRYSSNKNNIIPVHPNNNNWNSNSILHRNFFPGVTKGRTTTKITSSTSLFGIPKMFRWLTDQYPDVLNRHLNGALGLSDDIVVDNFYLDMNGIIHPCTHGNNKDGIDPSTGQPLVLDETAMFKKIFSYVDRLYKMVQPTKVLYLAIDGVAPRAKMNQQRSRRYRSAKEMEQSVSDYVARTNYVQGTGKNVFYSQYDYSTSNDAATVDPKVQKAQQRFDSNCITPGTDFMLKLNLSLQKWVAYKMESDPFWMASTACIIVSGPDVPGEGEHKVMDFIRDTRRDVMRHAKANDNPNDIANVNGNVNASADLLLHQYWYQPSYTHVLYGLDADLIMLGLVTHEPNFMLLRERMSVVMAGRGGGSGRGRRRNQQQSKKVKDMLEYDRNDYELLELSLLRRMLSIQFRRFADQDYSAGIEHGKDSKNDVNGRKQEKESYSLDRIIDDFVFTCMLVGNDFLPHVPHLEIDGGALSLMMSTYIDLMEASVKNDGTLFYLTKGDRIHPERMERFLYEISYSYEQEHFLHRGYDEDDAGWQLPAIHVETGEFLETEREEDFYGTHYSGMPTPTVAALANRGFGPDQEDPNLPPEENRAMIPVGNRAYRRQHPGSCARSYRDYYYECKLKWKTTDRSRTLYRRRQHVREFVRGLHWNLCYYHSGCPAWDWYFPYYYAPLASDMVNLREFYDDSDDEWGYCRMKFELGEPFPSLGQLLAVLPPQSAALLPTPLAQLMTDPSSPLVQYFPPDFATDPNGKRQSWEAIVQIPFIESSILLQTVQQVLNQNDKTVEPSLSTSTLTPSERRRNQRGIVHTFVPGHIRQQLLLPHDSFTTSATSVTKNVSSSKKAKGEIDANSLENVPKSKTKRSTKTSTDTAAVGTTTPSATKKSKKTLAGKSRKRSIATKPPTHPSPSIE